MRIPLVFSLVGVDQILFTDDSVQTSPAVFQSQGNTQKSTLIVNLVWEALLSMYCLYWLRNKEIALNC